MMQQSRGTGIKRLKSSPVIQALALLMAAYPFVSMILDSAMLIFNSSNAALAWVDAHLPTLSLGFYGSLLLLLFIRWNYQKISTRRMGIYTLLIILNGLLIGIFLVMAWFSASFIQQLTNILIPFA